MFFYHIFEKLISKLNKKDSKLEKAFVPKEWDEHILNTQNISVCWQTSYGISY